MGNRRSGWHWQAGDYWSTRVTGMQVIENPSEKPRRFPVGFGPPQENTELSSGHKPVSAAPFPPQIAARRRI